MVQRQVQRSWAALSSLLAIEVPVLSSLIHEFDESETVCRKCPGLTMAMLHKVESAGSGVAQTDA